MLKFYANRFATLITLLSNIGAGLQVVKKDQKVGKEEKEHLIKWISEAEEVCREIGLVVSLNQLYRVKRHVNSHDTITSTYLELFRNAYTVVLDEMNSVLLFRIQNEKAHYYTEVHLFGKNVTAKFQSANFDIREAGKCFALARYTACVMHLMRCLEVALKAMGISLNVNLTNPNWGNIINQVNSTVNANKAALGASWQAEAEFFTNAAAHFYSVKNAWRNPTMHVERKYTEEEAEDIFNAVKGVMRHIAKHLDESGNFTP